MRCVSDSLTAFFTSNLTPSHRSTSDRQYMHCNSKRLLSLRATENQMHRSRRHIHRINSSEHLERPVPNHSLAIPWSGSMLLLTWVTQPRKPSLALVARDPHAQSKRVSMAEDLARRRPRSTSYHASASRWSWTCADPLSESMWAWHDGFALVPLVAAALGADVCICGLQGGSQDLANEVAV